VQKRLDGRKGYLKRCDVITHVNDTAVEAKNKEEVIDLFNSSWKAVFDVTRVEGILAIISC
jgi:hypothetical protein